MCWCRGIACVTINFMSLQTSSNRPTEFMAQNHGTISHPDILHSQYIQSFLVFPAHRSPTYTLSPPPLDNSSRGDGPHHWRGMVFVFYRRRYEVTCAYVFMFSRRRYAVTCAYLFCSLCVCMCPIPRRLCSCVCPPFSKQMRVPHVYDHYSADALCCP